MPSEISDTKFADLNTKLRELFELDKSDLDFGIYRIIAAKNKEVTEFLDRQLKDVVRETLAAHGAVAGDQVQVELDKAMEQARSLGADPETIPKVKDLRAKLAATGGASARELEADIYNHLLAFFSRYYDEGDFISKRRYKGDVYAIPYGGEEVTLHWANKDQYYIKSGEWHKDYRFKAGGKTVRFKLVEATQETNNNKEAEEAKRRYILDAERPIEETADELTLRFQFRAPTEAERTRAADRAVAIFGGKYANSTKGDEREQFCADAEKRALAAMSSRWTGVVAAPAATETKPLRTLLGKHLDNFTARNTFDYFIHKDLGGFLRRELDFYIKNEVVRLDDLEALPADHLARVQGKVKAIRRVAGRIIDFLASIENFQKKMWLKKKLVLETNWLVTVDRIPPELRDVVAANAEQWKEWERLGFKPEQATDELIERTKWGTRAYLHTNDKLVVDTQFFDGRIHPEVGVFEGNGSLAGPSTDNLTGTLIHGENFQGLSLLAASYVATFQCVYIDPPYNSGNDGFAYKDSLQHSSWLSLIDDRLIAARNLMTFSSAIFASIDDGEAHRLKLKLDDTFGIAGFIAEIIWQKRYAPDVRTSISDAHEFILSYGPSPEAFKAVRNKLPLTDAQTSQFKNPDNDSRGPWKAADFTAPGYRANQMYEIRTPTGRVVVPPTGRCWGVTEPNFIELAADSRMYYGADQSGLPAVKRFLKDMDGMVPWTWWNHEDVGHSQDGLKEFMKLFGREDAFLTAKPPSLIRRIAQISTNKKDSILDYFAGSGTTGQATIELNREDGGARQFMLIEMGAHFQTILKPRIIKVLYSPDWKDGNAQTHGKGVSALVKYFALESYEDALNNLPAPSGELLAGMDAAGKEAMITYSLDLEMGPNLLNLEVFRDPWGYSINAQPAGEAESRRHRVDLVETFNYLLGLKVKAYGPMERYSAEFEKAEHAEGLGRVKVKGRLRREKIADNGPFVFQRVEGEINDAQGTRVLVVWRKLTGDAEQDAAVLDAWMKRHGEETKERSAYREYQLIYINGPVTLPQPTAEIRTVWPIEQTFKDRMFASDEGV